MPFFEAMFGGPLIGGGGGPLIGGNNINFNLGGANGLKYGVIATGVVVAVNLGFRLFEYFKGGGGGGGGGQQTINVYAEVKVEVKKPEHST